MNAPAAAAQIRCTNCGYDVTHCDRAGPCTECGVPVARTFECHAFALSPAGAAISASVSLVLAALALVILAIVGAIAASMMPVFLWGGADEVVVDMLACAAIAHMILLACAALRLLTMPPVAGMRRQIIIMSVACGLFAGPVAVLVVTNMFDPVARTAFVLYLALRAAQLLALILLVHRFIELRATLLHARRSWLIALLAHVSLVIAAIGMAGLVYFFDDMFWGARGVLFQGCDLMLYAGGLMAFLLAIPAGLGVRRHLRRWRRAIGAIRAATPATNPALRNGLILFMAMTAFDLLVGSLPQASWGSEGLVASAIARFLALCGLRRLDRDEDDGHLEFTSIVSWIWCAAPIIRLLNRGFVDPLQQTTGFIAMAVGIGGALAIALRLRSAARRRNDAIGRWWSGATALALVALGIDQVLAGLGVPGAMLWTASVAPPSHWLLIVSAAFVLAALRRPRHEPVEAPSGAGEFIALAVVFAAAVVAARFAHSEVYVPFVAAVALMGTLWIVSSRGLCAGLFRALTIVLLAVGASAAFFLASEAPMNVWGADDGGSPIRPMAGLWQVCLTILGIAILSGVSSRAPRWRGTANVLFIVLVCQVSALVAFGSWSIARVAPPLSASIVALLGGDLPLFLLAGFIPFAAAESLARQRAESSRPLAVPMPPVARESWPTPPMTRLDAEGSELMSQKPVVRTAPTDMRCLRCGYIVGQLPGTSNCPECGFPVAQSIVIAIENRMGRTGAAPIVVPLLRGVLLVHAAFLTIGFSAVYPETFKLVSMPTNQPSLIATASLISGLAALLAWIAFVAATWADAGRSAPRARFLALALPIVDAALRCVAFTGWHAVDADDPVRVLAGLTPIASALAAVIYLHGLMRFLNERRGARWLMIATVALVAVSIAMALIVLNKSVMLPPPGMPSWTEGMQFAAQIVFLSALVRRLKFVAKAIGCPDDVAIVPRGWTSG